MKNIVFLLIDSLNYSHVKKSPIVLMPFLESLKQRGFCCENMFSEAPYTEAALMSLLCGQDVLDHGGYMFRYKDTPMTLFEAMQKKGYETFTTSYEPQCHPSSVGRGIDISVNGVGYDVAALWSYRIKHYSQLFHSELITDDDIETLYEIVKDNLESWIKFTDDLINQTSDVSMISTNAPQYDAKSVRSRVSKEYEKFISDSRGYINELLEKGHDHPIYSIEGYAQKRKIENREIIPFVKEEFTPLFRRIRKMDFKLNLKNGGGVLKGPVKKIGQFIKHPNEESLKNVAKSGLLSINSLFDLDLFDRINTDCDCFKDAPSLRTQIDYYIEWTKKRQSDKPYFAVLHVCDVHNPEIFFTYDSSDKQLLHQEAADANELLNQIPNDYHGSLSHDLSLRYIDGVLQYFYEQLEENNYDKDTIVIICADHGFSFSGNPLRDSAVVNLYLENYNIPFVVTGAGHEGVSIDKMCESKDIPATICDLVDGVIPETYTGHSVLKDFEYDSLKIEYCGGGCPDLGRRELKIAVFDKDYFVGTLGKLDDFSSGILTEVYDLKNDPIQLNNLINKKYDQNKVQSLLNKIYERKKEIQISADNLRKMKKDNVYN